MAQVTLTQATVGQVLTAAFYNNNNNALLNQINGNLDSTNLADSAVTTAKIAASAVTPAKMDLTGAFGTFTGAWTFENLGLNQVSAAPTTGSAECRLYVKAVSGTPELFVRKASSGAEVQLTSGGGFGVVLDEVSAQSAATDNSTTVLPVDNTIPQNSEGKEISALNCTITPKSALSILRFEIDLYAQHNSGQQIGIGIFKDADADAVGAAYINDAVSFQPGHIRFGFDLVAGSTTARTYKLRVGPASSGTVYINADSTGTGRMGGKIFSRMKITEVRP